MMAKSKEKQIHTISLLVANKPGVLVRIAMAFARRGYNIDSLVVSPSSNEKFSRMTISAQGEIDTLDQILRQTGKLIDVIHAWEHNDNEAVHSELALFKLHKKGNTRSAIEKIIAPFRARILDDADDFFIVEQVGVTPELDQLEKNLKKSGVVEMVRTGKVVMVKGHHLT